MKKIKISIITIFVCFFNSYSQNIAYPVSNSVKNFKTDFLALGNGIADDTNALNNALNSNFKGIIFIPNGTYKITNAVTKLNQGLGTFFHGESKDGVIFKLVDGATGFGNTSSPKAMITGCDDPNGVSADVFYYQWKNFTVDVGNNTGAIGVRFYSNNVGSMTNIRIKGTNAEIGLDMGWRDQNGPNLISKIDIEGFKTGFSTNNILNSQTLSEITIKNCLIGVKAFGQSLSIEDLVTTNVAEPVKTNSILTLINSSFGGGNGTKPAIDLQGGQLFARNLISSGYTNIIGGQSTVSGSTISEWTPTSTLFNFADHKPTSLNLTIKKTPDFPLEPDLSKWVSANSFGATANGSNVSIAFQQAIDAAALAGKTTVYFEASNTSEPNWYLIQGDVHIYGSVKHIIGLGFARFVSEGNTIPKLIIDANAAPIIKIENMYRLGGNSFNIVNNYTSTLIVEHIDGAPITISGPSELYLNDFSSKIEITNTGAKVWARQLNPEVSNTNNILVERGKLWVLGLKTEKSQPIIVRLGGSLEVLGAHIYNTCSSPTNPLFEVVDASASFACIREICFCGGTEYTVHVKETRGANTINFLKTVPFRQWDLFSATVATPLSNNDFEFNNSKIITVYPNPVDGLLKIDYTIDKTGLVNVAVYDLLGKKIQQILYENKENGNYQQTINTENFAKGIYFLKINEKISKFIKN